MLAIAWQVNWSAGQGFARLALESGASLVPVLSFGENDLFDATVVGGDTAMGRFQSYVAPLLPALVTNLDPPQCIQPVLHFCCAKPRVIAL